MKWFGKSGDIFRNNLCCIPDEEKVCLLLWRLEIAECDELTSFIYPRTISDLTVNKTVLILSDWFGFVSVNYLVDNDKRKLGTE